MKPLRALELRMLSKPFSLKSLSDSVSSETGPARLLRPFSRAKTRLDARQDKMLLLSEYSFSLPRSRRWRLQANAIPPH
jgi:hypothetical protein